MEGSEKARAIAKTGVTSETSSDRKATASQKELVEFVRETTNHIVKTYLTWPALVSNLSDMEKTLLTSDGSYSHP